jgi:hypothetical protein
MSSTQPKKFQVKKKVVYSERQPTAQEQAANVIYQKDGELAKPEMVNRAIEDPEVRSKIPLGKGNICISIQAGDTLGDLSFNVQFEGRRGEYDFCVHEHNELLLGVSDWLQEILGQFEGNFDVTLESKPCPKTDVRVALDLAERILERQTNLQQTRHELKPEITVTVGPDRRIDIQNRNY